MLQPSLQTQHSTSGLHWLRSLVWFYHVYMVRFATWMQSCTAAVPPSVLPALHEFCDELGFSTKRRNVRQTEL